MPGSEEFRRVLLAARPDLYAFSLSLTRDPSRAEDLVQESLLRALKARAQLRETAAARVWLFRILHRIFLDTRRQNRLVPDLKLLPGGRGLEEELSQAGHSSDEILQRLEARRFLRRLSRRVPAAGWSALLLREAWGMTYREIAKVQDCKVGTVRSRIARTRQEARCLMRRRFPRVAGGGP